MLLLSLGRTLYKGIMRESRVLGGYPGELTEESLQRGNQWSGDRNRDKVRYQHLSGQEGVVGGPCAVHWWPPGRGGLGVRVRQSDLVNRDRALEASPEKRIWRPRASWEKRLGRAGPSSSSLPGQTLCHCRDRDYDDIDDDDPFNPQARRIATHNPPRGQLHSFCSYSSGLGSQSSLQPPTQTISNAPVSEYMYGQPGAAPSCPALERSWVSWFGPYGHMWEGRH